MFTHRCILGLFRVRAQRIGHFRLQELYLLDHFTYLVPQDAEEGQLQEGDDTIADHKQDVRSAPQPLVQFVQTRVIPHGLTERRNIPGHFLLGRCYRQDVVQSQVGTNSSSPVATNQRLVDVLQIGGGGTVGCCAKYDGRRKRLSCHDGRVIDDLWDTARGRIGTIQMQRKVVRPRNATALFLDLQSVPQLSKVTDNSIFGVEAESARDECLVDQFRRVLCQCYTHFIDL